LISSASFGSAAQRHRDVARDEIAGDRDDRVWRMAPPVKIATSVVPAPMSTSGDASPLVSVNTAWLDALGFSTS